MKATDDGGMTIAETAIRRTMNKIVGYTYCPIFGTSLAVSFGKQAINYAAMVCVLGNEVTSIVGDFDAVHGCKVAGLYAFLLKLIGKKAGIDASVVRIKEIPLGGHRDESESRQKTKS